MERPEIYTDNYNSLEEWIELRKRNEEFVYPQFFVPFREWMKDIEQKSDMEIKELLRILLQPYTLGVDTVDTYEFYKEYVQDKVNKEKNLQTYELCMNQLKYNERIYRIKNKQEAWEGLTWVLPLLNINPMKALKALGMYFDAECIYMPDDRIHGISDEVVKQIKSFTDELKHSGTIDFILSDVKGTTVLSVQEQYLANDNISEILGGHFKVLGKVISICKEDTENIDLLRKTSLSIFQEDLLNELFAELKTDDMKQFNLPELRTKIESPAVIVIPIAIYA